jgi:predicted unusual protein kinase regulating ubiquinone biosynthesis (AarF/ABC1/UbiB family)
MNLKGTLSAARTVQPLSASRTTVQVQPLSASRTVRLWKFAAEYQWRFRGDQPQGAPLGKWLRNEMTELGPAFIKMGQFMSTRTDIFGSALTAELARLQDDANPVSFDVLKPVIERELGFELDTVFAEFDTEPIASASIGQVHRAKMRTRDGKTFDTVVKIQKPRVREQILEDVAILKKIAELAAWTGTQRGREAQQLLKQYETFLKAELDYKSEVDNMLAFRRILKESGEPIMLVPRPFPTLCTENVLVMEYIPSVKITAIEQLREANVDTKLVASAVVNIFIQQIVAYGLVHCDPHPGNIGIIPSASGNGDFSVVLYDFGNVVALSQAFREQINNLIVSIVQEDVDEFLSLLVSLQIIRVSDPIELLEIKSFFSYFFDYLKTVDFQKLRTSITDNEALQQSQIGFKVDNDFLALFRVFSLLDGTCTLLDPEFSYMTALGPVSQEVFQNTTFIEYRMRKDMSKLSLFNAPSSTMSDDTIMALSTRIRDIGDKTSVFRGMFLALAVLDGIDDPLRLTVIVPMLAWLALSQKK